LGIGDWVLGIGEAEGIETEKIRRIEGKKE
jgi:hypothetical protein